MVIVPIQAVPNQQLNASLNGQACTIEVQQTRYGLFCTLLVAGAQIIGGVLCQNLNRIVRDLYLGFSGDLMFLDTQGSDAPYYSGLGTRWLLVYLAPSDLPAGAG